jgi:hypothetical protein
MPALTRGSGTPARGLRYLTGLLVVVAFFCVERALTTGSLGWSIAAGASFVGAAVTGVVAVSAAPPGGAERSAARTTLVFVLVILAAAVLYFLIGLHNLSN